MEKEKTKEKQIEPVMEEDYNDDIENNDINKLSEERIPLNCRVHL